MARTAVRQASMAIGHSSMAQTAGLACAGSNAHHSQNRTQVRVPARAPLHGASRSGTLAAQWAFERASDPGGDMEAMSPQGALLAQCIARLPERSLPRHAWAAEVLVEQLWACSVGAGHEEWRPLLAPMIADGGVDARRVRGEVWRLARSGALEPAGIGRLARFTVTPEAVQESRCVAPINCSTNEVVTQAVVQLTARLLASSK